MSHVPQIGYAVLVIGEDTSTGIAILEALNEAGYLGLLCEDRNELEQWIELLTFHLFAVIVGDHPHRLQIIEQLHLTYPHLPIVTICGRVNGHFRNFAANRTLCKPIKNRALAETLVTIEQSKDR